MRAYRSSVHKAAIVVTFSSHAINKDELGVTTIYSKEENVLKYIPGFCWFEFDRESFLTHLLGF